MKGEKRIAKSGIPYYNYYQKLNKPRKGTKRISKAGVAYYHIPYISGSYHNAYSDIKRAVLERDGYTCQVCGQATDNLHIHHRDNNGYSKTNKPDNSLSNLIAVCAPCHMKYHFSVSGRNSSIVFLRSTGLTFQEIGDIFGVSRQRIHQIYLANVRRDEPSRSTNQGNSLPISEKA